MRDPSLMLSLLEEMAQNLSGQMVNIHTFGMSEEEQRRRHHVELPIDAGHAEWVSAERSIVRITNCRGMQYVEAANRVVRLVSESFPE